MTRVLVLRPEPGASTTVERACSRGLDAIAVPLFEIEPIEWLAPETGSFDGLLLTSANAIGFGGKQLRKLRNLKVYAVGQATAEAAHDAGFDIAATGEAGVDGLLASIDPDLKLLHLCGANRREPRDAKQAITTVIVYHSNEIETSDFPVTPDIVALIHSPRAGRRFAEVAGDRSEIRIAAISTAAADAVGLGWKAVAVADQPSDEGLLALAARLCNKPDPE